MDERQQFDQMVLPHLDDALSLARWLAGNVADAEDIVQEACIRAYRAIATVQSHKSRAWLLAIVRNTAFTWLAKNRPKNTALTDDDRLFEQAKFEVVDGRVSPTPEAVLIAKAESDQLHKALAALPLAFREAIVLREIEGLSYREISEVTAVPVGTVMSRLARARSMLMQMLGEVARNGAGKAGAA